MDLRPGGLNTVRSVLHGIASAAAQLVAAEAIAARLPAAPSPLASVERAFVDRTRAPVSDAVLTLLGGYSKPLLKVSVVGALLGVGFAAGAIPPRARRIAPVLFVLSALAMGRISTKRPDTTPQAALLPVTIGMLVGITEFRVLSRRSTAATIVSAAATISAAMAPAPRLKPIPQQGLPPPVTKIEMTDDMDFGIPDVRPLLTPTDHFYIVHLAIKPPHVDVDRWQLRIHGEVQRDFAVTYADLLKMPLVEVVSTMVCVHNHVGGDRVSTGVWTGVPVTDLLRHVGVHDGADQILAHSVTEDSMSSGLPLSALSQLNPIIAVGLNGQPLKADHGFPARLLTPGAYGQWANVKWLQSLEISQFKESPDYWAQRGWPTTGWVNPGAQIDTPRPYASVSPGDCVIAGVAWNPPHGVSGVEVSIDDGEWKRAELAAELAPTAWRQWRLVWRANPGRHCIRVRCDGQSGEVQTAFPGGFSGYHCIAVTVGFSDAPLKKTVIIGADQLTTRLRYLACVPFSWINPRPVKDLPLAPGTAAQPHVYQNVETSNYGPPRA